ncbi:hypothetical protein CCACVL1_16068 [Corchorus capsularis]|uniref:Uncharacterized protein n=1 Tax=Corchorus capsularis TaxID=210143 RepID=A0A1R3HZK9_COCAP|nr:hypothetical protein CCACVL1_16068 [Corchorus capsularis]
MEDKVRTSHQTKHMVVRLGVVDKRDLSAMG